MARKEKKVGKPTMSLVFVGMACFFVVGAGAGYLWNKKQIHELGQQIRNHEMRLESAKRHRLMLERTYAAMCSPADLDERVKRMRLEIGPPQLDQIIKLEEVWGVGQGNTVLAVGVVRDSKQGSRGHSLSQDGKLLARRPTKPDEEGTN
jgi:hypothetical protein